VNYRKPIVASCSSSLVVVLLLSCTAAAESPVHTRVTWNSDPAKAATISWSTREPGEAHTAKFRERNQGEWKEITCQRNGKFSGRGKALYYHHVRLANLKPSTQYELRVQSDGDEAGPYWFQTAPNSDAPFQLLFGGDSRSSSEHRRKMNDLMKRLAAQADRTGGPTVLALAHGGDYILSGQNVDQWNQWMSDHMLTTSDEGRLLPVIPARGNHDVGEGFNEVFDFPRGDTNYYGVTIAGVVRLVTLNTETSTVGDQQQWLAQELASQRPTHRWLLCQYHRPAFPAVKIPSSAFGSWVPLFEKHKVDLCLEADGHCIKRTPAIRGTKFDPSGVVYIGEGGLGVGQRTPKDNRWYLQAPAVTGQGHHVNLLTFEGDQLIGKVILQDNSTFDEFQLTARGAKALPKQATNEQTDGKTVAARAAIPDLTPSTTPSTTPASTDAP